MAGILHSKGVLAGTGVLGKSGVILSKGGDPLASIPMVLRLQANRGLYQDVACTIPATADGHVIAAWKDELSGSSRIYSQGTSTKRPVLKIISGRPVVRFDGVDDQLSGNMPAMTDCSVAMSARMNTAAANTYWLWMRNILGDNGNALISGFGQTTVDRFESNAGGAGRLSAGVNDITAFHTHGFARDTSTTTYRDGVAVTTAAGIENFVAGSWFLSGATSETTPINGDVKGLCISSQKLTQSQMAVIAAYLNAL